MKRAPRRAVALGYSDDPRGTWAYLHAPEAWTKPAFNAFVMAAGGLIIILMINAAAGGDPWINVPFATLGSYFFVVRPASKIAKRRADRDGPLDPR